MKLFKTIMVLALFSSLSLFAKKGDWEIGVGLQMINHTDKFKDNYYPGAGLNFNVGTFVNERLLVGGQYNGNFIMGKNLKHPGGSVYNIENWAMNHDIGAFTRYYFMNFQKKISPFVGIDAGYSFITESIRLKDDAGNQIEKYEETNGLMFISPSIGCSLPLSYSTTFNLALKYTWTYINETNAGIGGTSTVSYFSTFKHFDLQMTFNFML